MKTNYRLNRRLALVTFFLAISYFAISQIRVRDEIEFPDIPGYLTLKCDFHIHTVFSDGNVWPTVRPEEAWREGLDAISITDHIEYQPHKDDLPTNHNRSYEIALPKSEELGLLLIRGAEITRDMPPGHFNALFLKNVNLLDVEDWREAIIAAVNQDAFIIWNHPGWRQPDEIPIWYDEHTEIFQKGWVKGMEIVNERSYYPKAHQWCIDKNITMIGTSDIHDPVNLNYKIHEGEHRPITLVFAKTRTKEAIKEALLNRRTAVYHNNLLIGEEQYLSPVFYGSIKIMNREITIKENQWKNIRIHNYSDIDLELEAAVNENNIDMQKKVTLAAHKTSLLRVQCKSEKLEGTINIELPYTVTNFLIAPGKGLPVKLKFQANIIRE